MELPGIEIIRTTEDTHWSYADLDLYQKEIAKRIIEEGDSGALIFSEVSPVITLGNRADESSLLVPKDKLIEYGVEIYPTHRGGLATYHGPGQWVVFAVDRLDRLVGDGKGVRKAVDALLHIARDSCASFGKRAEIKWGDETGVWGETGKLASVGVKIQNGVLLHGLCINAFPTETSFMGIHPCGIECKAEYLFTDYQSSVRLEEKMMELQQVIETNAFSYFWKSDQ